MLNKFIFILSILLFLSCSSSQNELPEGILSHEELVPIITDIEIAQGYLKIKSSINDYYETRFGGFFYIFKEYSIV